MSKELEEAREIFSQLKGYIHNSNFLNENGKKQLYNAIDIYNFYIDNSVSKDKIKELVTEMRKNGSNYWANEIIERFEI